MAKIKDDMDFGDMPDFDADAFGGDLDATFSGGDKPGGKRSPVAKLGGAFVGGVGEGFMSPENHREMIRRTLPKGYSAGYDAADNGLRDLKDVYGEAREGISHVTGQIKRGVPSAINAFPLPQSWKKRALEWAKTGQQSSGPEIDQDEASIAMAQGDVFSQYKAGSAPTNPVDAQKDTASMMSDIADKIQAGTANETLAGIRTAVSRLAAYQDQVTINYQKKTLEIAMRHYFVSRKSLDILNQSLELSKASYRDLIINTSLPDIVKTKNSELFHQTIKQKFIGNILSSNGYNSVRANIIRKAKTSIKSFFKESGTAISDTMMALGGMEESGVDMNGMLVRSAGGAAAKKLMGMVPKGIKEKLAGNAKVKAYGTMMHNFGANREEIMNRLLSDEDSGVGPLEWLKSTGFLSEFRPKGDNILKKEASASMDELAHWDMQSKKSLEEVIPGWLKLIHAETHALRTGAKELAPLDYNWKTGNFEDSEKVGKGIAASMLSDTKLKDTAITLKRMLQQIDPTGKELSKSARVALTSYLLGQLKSQKSIEWAKISSGAVSIGKNFDDDTSIRNAIVQNILKGQVYQGGNTVKEEERWTNTNTQAMGDSLAAFKEHENAARQAVMSSPLNKKMALDAVRLNQGHHLVNNKLASYDKDGNLVMDDSRITKNMLMMTEKMKLDQSSAETSVERLAREAREDVIAKAKATMERTEGKSWMSRLGDTKVGGFAKSLYGSGRSAVDNMTDSQWFNHTKEYLEQKGAKISQAAWNKMTETQQAKWLQDNLNKIDQAVLKHSDTKGGGFDFARQKPIKPDDEAPEVHHTGGIAGASGSAKRKMPLGMFGPTKYHSGGVAGGLPNIEVTKGRGRGEYYTTSPTGEKISWIYKGNIQTKSGQDAAQRWVKSEHLKRFGEEYKQPKLAANEVPAILEKGEEVLTRSDPRHRKNMPRGKKSDLDPQTTELKLVNATLATMTNLLMTIAEKDYLGLVPSGMLSKMRDAVRSGYGTAKAFATKPYEWASKKLGGAFDTTWAGLGRIRSGVMEKLRGLDYGGLKAYAMAGWDKVKDGSKKIFSEAWQKGGGWLADGVVKARQISDWVMDKSGKPIKFLKDSAKATWEYFTKGDKSLWERLRSGGGEAWSRIKGAGADAWGMVSPFLTQGFGGLKEKLGEKVKDLFAKGKEFNAKVKETYGKAKDGIKKFFDQPKNIVAEGGGAPLITVAQLREGKLRDVNTGAVVTKLEDITGAVRTTSGGKRVITAAQFKAGIRYATLNERMTHKGVAAHNAVKKQVTRLKGAYTSVKGAIGKGISAFKDGGWKTPFKMLAKPFSAMKAFGMGLLKGSSVYKATDIQRDTNAIVDEVSGLKAVNNSISKLGMLVESMKVKRKGLAFWQNADGTRKGDEKIADKVKNFVGPTKPADAKETKSKLGSMFDLLKKVGGKAAIMAAAGVAAGALTRWVFGDKFANEHSTTVHGVEAAAALATTKAGRKAEWWAAKNVAKGAWNVAKFAGRALASQGVRSAAVAAGTMALEAGGALLAGAGAVISAPVVVGALLVAAVAYGGYRLYKHFADKKAPITRFRMAQYGIDFNDSKQATAIMDMELALLKKTVASAGGPATISAGLKPEDFYKSFGVDPKDKKQTAKWVRWFVHRFKPIYITHVTQMFSVLKSKDLSKIDELIGGKPGVEYLKHVHWTSREMSPYLIMESPFGDDKKVKYDAGDVNDAFTNATKIIAGLPDKGVKSTDAPKITDPKAALSAKKDQAKADKTATDQKARDADKTKQLDKSKADSEPGFFKRSVNALGRFGEALGAGAFAAHEVYERGGTPLQQFNAAAASAGESLGFKSKGTVDVNKMVAWLNSNSGTSSKGICATFVRKGLEAGGANTGGHPVSAKDYGDTLLRNGFKEVGATGYTPQKGDICVFGAHQGHPHGHICVFNGQQWVSDFKQRDMNPYKGRPAVPYKIYRSEKAIGGGLSSALGRGVEFVKNVGSAVGQGVQAASATYKRTGSVFQAANAGASYAAQDYKDSKLPNYSVSQKQAQADLIAAAKKWGITDPKEVVMLLAQTAHESGGYKYLKELGKAAYFTKYDGRKDLGNTQPGDGARFKGRGYLQTTGRANYTAFAKATGMDVINHPELLETPAGAAESSLFWWMHSKRARAAGQRGDVLGATKAVNGGTNGLDDRQAKYGQAMKQFSAAKSLDEMLKMVGTAPSAAATGTKAPAAAPATAPAAGAKGATPTSTAKPTPGGKGAATIAAGAPAAAPGGVKAATPAPTPAASVPATPPPAASPAPAADNSAALMAANQNAAAAKRSQDTKNASSTDMVDILRKQLAVQNTMSTTLLQIAAGITKLGGVPAPAAPAAGASPSDIPGKRPMTNDATAPVPMGMVGMA